MNKKLPDFLFKTMAVVSALAIGGAYISWRQTETNKAKQPEPSNQANAKADQEEKDKPIDVIIGSKSPGGTFLRGEDFINVIPGIPEGSDAPTNIVPLLPGSKSIVMPLFSTRDISKDEEPLPPLEILDDEETTNPSE